VKYDVYFGSSNERFALGKSGRQPLVIIGLNPSTADAFHNDATIRKIEGQLEVWKEFDGFLMLNLYPARASKPEQLNQFDEGLAILNAKLIHHLLEEIKNRVVWAAWGNHFDGHPFFADCLRYIQVATADLKIRWCKCETLTEKKNPRHPIGGRPNIITKRSLLSVFDLEGYLLLKSRHRQ